MGYIKRVGRMQLPQDENWQRLDWRLQRAGWVLMALLLLAAALGLFGNGPLARAEAGDGSGMLRIQYDRFVRHHATFEIELYAAPPPAGEPLSLEFDAAWLAQLGLLEILPNPSDTKVEGNRIAFEFDTPEAVPAGQSSEPAQITLVFEPDVYGRVTGVVGLADGPTVDVAHFVYP